MKMIHENISDNSKVGESAFHDRIDLLLSRVNLLRGKDKVLMKMYFEKGNNFHQMALLAGVSEATISRRVHKLTQRLIDGEYIICLRNRSRFTSFELCIARDHFLGGFGIKKIAAKRGCSFYKVRETLKKIQRLIQIRAGEQESD